MIYHCYVFSCLSDAQKRKIYDADSDDYESDDDDDLENLFSHLFQNMPFFFFQGQNPRFGARERM